jgi:O-antigen/teichoic acid export membrane protein
MAVAHFGFGQPDRRTAILFVILAISLSIAFRMRVYPALLKGNLKFKVLILASSTRVAIFSAAVLLLGLHRLTLELLVAIHVLLQLSEQACLYLAARPLIQLGDGRPLEQEERREVVRFAGKNVVALVAMFFRERVDTQLLASFVSLSAVGQYSVGMRFPVLLMDFSNSLFGGHLVSGFTLAAARKGPQEMLRDVLSVIRLSACVSFSASTLLFFLGPPFIRRWLGPGFDPACEILQISLPGIALAAMSYPWFSILPAMNKHGRLGAAFLCTAGINFVVSLILVQRIGGTGVVWGTTLDLCLQSLVVLPWLVGRTFGVHWWSYLGDSVLRPALCFLLFVAPAAWLWVKEIQPAGYLELIGAGAVLGCLAAGVCWALVLRSTERAFILGQVHRWLPLARLARRS